MDSHRTQQGIVLMFWDSIQWHVVLLATLNLLMVFDVLGQLRIREITEEHR